MDNNYVNVVRMEYLWHLFRHTPYGHLIYGIPDYPHAAPSGIIPQN
ncbi:MAG: hypothetical protein ABL884_07830 [Methyloglobulus sp.]